MAIFKEAAEFLRAAFSPEASEGVLIKPGDIFVGPREVKVRKWASKRQRPNGQFYTEVSTTRVTLREKRSSQAKTLKFSGSPHIISSEKGETVVINGYLKEESLPKHFIGEKGLHIIWGNVLQSLGLSSYYHSKDVKAKQIINGYLRYKPPARFPFDLPHDETSRTETPGDEQISPDGRVVRFCVHTFEDHMEEQEVRVYSDGLLVPVWAEKRTSRNWSEEFLVIRDDFSVHRVSKQERGRTVWVTDDKKIREIAACFSGFSIEKGTGEVDKSLLGKERRRIRWVEKPSYSSQITVL